MPTDLSMLLCGNPSEKTELSEILGHMAGALDVLVTQTELLRKQDDRRLTLFGPYLGRSLLEVGLTAIAARLDPFRVLVLREMQRQPGYDVATRWATSIQWGRMTGPCGLRRKCVSF